MTRVTQSEQTSHPAIKESLVILIAGLLQFINMLDFVMVMPLGPDFAHDLGMPISDVGLVAGSYAFAAGFAGLVGSFFLDNFARKRALLFFLTGLSIATLGGAIAWNRESMLIARVIAGLCGGPLGALSAALVADYIIPQRRGRAMGKVMGAFSIASVLGIPAGLELAHIFTWHAPFIVTSCLGFISVAIIARVLPYHGTLVGKTLLKHRVKAMGILLRKKEVILSYLLVITSMVGAFILIPNISAHIQINMHYPRARLGLLYFVGGFISFFTMRWAGILIDKTSSAFVSTLSTAVFVVVAFVGFIYYHHAIPVLLIFVCFMVAMTTRNICGQALFSKIPPPAYRGAYMSLQNAFVYATQGLVAYVASLILVEQDGQLLNVPTLGWISIAASLTIPPLFYYIESHLKKAN